jgi:hypothetical protein
MTGNDLRALLRARPFQPFPIRLVDGTEVRVPRAEWAIVSPNGRTMVAYEAARGPCTIIDTDRITAVGYDPPPPEPDVAVQG